MDDCVQLGDQSVVKWTYFDQFGCERPVSDTDSISRLFERNISRENLCNGASGYLPDVVPDARVGSRSAQGDETVQYEQKSPRSAATHHRLCL